MSYQNTLLKPENPTQGHTASRHKDVRYATKTSSYAMKTSSYAMKTSITPRRHQLCHEDINYAMKTSIMPQNINPPQRQGAKIPMSQRLRHLVG